MSARREGPTAPGDEPSGFAFKPLNYALFGGAIAAILLGYILLDRGSVTAAPILLVVGYIVLIPAALLVGMSARRGGRDSAPED